MNKALLYSLVSFICFLFAVSGSHALRPAVTTVMQSAVKNGKEQKQLDNISGRAEENISIVTRHGYPSNNRLTDNSKKESFPFARCIKPLSGPGIRYRPERIYLESVSASSPLYLIHRLLLI